MNGNQTEIQDPEHPGEKPKKFAFDYSYWSHDGFTEQPNGYLTPKDASYADQVHVISVFHPLSITIVLSSICVNDYNMIIGEGCSSEVERSLMVRWVVGLILHGVDPLSYFSL